MALTWETGANGYTAMNLMEAWFKRRCTASSGDAVRRRTSGGRELFTNRVGMSTLSSASDVSDIIPAAVHVSITDLLCIAAEYVHETSYV